jgi:hypothetical protein
MVLPGSHLESRKSRRQVVIPAASALFSNLRKQGRGLAMLTTNIECLDAFHRAGWTINDTAIHNAVGRLVWIAWGRNGENWVRAEGATSAEAWLAAGEQARLLGMLRG